MVKCIEQFLLFNRFETLYTLLQQIDFTVCSNLGASVLISIKIAHLSIVDVDRFPLVTGPLPLLRQMVEQASVVDTSQDALVKKAVLVLGKAVQYLPLRGGWALSLSPHFFLIPSYRSEGESEVIHFPVLISLVRLISHRRGRGTAGPTCGVHILCLSSRNR
jgi:hypothetical protein